MKERYSTEHSLKLNRVLLRLKLELGYNSKENVIWRAVRHLCASEGIKIKEEDV